MLSIQLKHALGVIIFLLGGMQLSATNNIVPVLNPEDPLDNISFETIYSFENTDICAVINENFPKEMLSADEATALLFMREEEKLARDVYIKMHEKWGSKPFDNIRQAEERHMAAIECLIEKYDLVDPVIDESVGVFQNQELDQLYQTLINKGNKSEAEAFVVGAMIEDLDLLDLRIYRQSIDNDDMLAVFTELERGTRNHLRAFNKNMNRTNKSYKPEHLDQEAYDAIVHGDMERGGKLWTNLGKGKNVHGKKSGNDNGEKLGKGKGNQPCTGDQNGQGKGNKPCAGNQSGKKKGTQPCTGNQNKQGNQGKGNQPCNNFGKKQNKGKNKWNRNNLGN